MNITFLVGNGFDISAGVDTSYSSFYKWYCLQRSPTFYIQGLKNDIQHDIEAGGRNWSDFEIGLGKYTAQFSPDNVDAFLQCYEDSIENIITYLEQEKSKFDATNISETDIASFRDGILNFYQELNPQERRMFEELFRSDQAYNTTINFISYNYTDILDQYVDKASSTSLKQWKYDSGTRQIKINPKVLHIHGTSNEYPILGIGDETQIANKDLLSVPHFATTMIKSQSVASIGQLWYTQADGIIERSRIICIWGMSLGLSDSKWWSNITEWLKANKERHLILFWHTKTPPSRRSVLQYNQQTDLVKNIMLDYSSFTASEITSIKNRIHVVFNTEKVLRVSLSPAPEKELVFT